MGIRQVGYFGNNSLLTKGIQFLRNTVGNMVRGYVLTLVPKYRWKQTGTSQPYYIILYRLNDLRRNELCEGGKAGLNDV